mmetsp:Transcript_48836/g.109893  ORF Transcript_48836/g.109893 Transcript_48836/m.109893 type:complete len:216 (-) Transcript_48836:380-1027(-)
MELWRAVSRLHIAAEPSASPRRRGRDVPTAAAQAHATVTHRVRYGLRVLHSLTHYFHYNTITKRSTPSKVSARLRGLLIVCMHINNACVSLLPSRLARACIASLLFLRWIVLVLLLGLCVRCDTPHIDPCRANGTIVGKTLNSNRKGGILVAVLVVVVLGHDMIHDQLRIYDRERERPPDKLGVGRHSRHEVALPLVHRHCISRERRAPRLLERM